MCFVLSFFPPCLLPFILPGHPAVPSAKVSRCRGALATAANPEAAGVGSRAGTHRNSGSSTGKHLCSSSWTVAKCCLCWTCQAGEQMTRSMPNQAGANLTKLCLTSIIEALQEGSLKSPQGYVLHRWPAELPGILVLIFSSKLAHYIYYCSSD